MLFLILRVGANSYAIESEQILEVLPLISWQTPASTRTDVAGVINYHGAPIPLLDLAQFLFKRDSRLRMSTRILVIEACGERIGLLAEQVTETVHLSEGDFQKDRREDVPHLGPITVNSGRVIQKIEVSRMIAQSDLRHLARTETSP